MKSVKGYERDKRASNKREIIEQRIREREIVTWMQVLSPVYASVVTHELDTCHLTRFFDVGVVQVWWGGGGREEKRC